MSTITIAPQVIDVRQTNESESTTTLQLTNEGAKPAVITVEAKDWFGLITAEPSQFVLDPQRQQSVDLTFYKLPAGRYETDVIVLAREIGSSIQQLPSETHAPVRLDIAAVSSGINPMIIIIPVFLLLAFLAGFLFINAAPIKYHLSLMWKRFIKQPSLKPPVIIIASLALVLTVSLLIWGLRANNNRDNPVPANQTNEAASYHYEIAITQPDQHQLFQIESEQPLTAFAALQKTAEQYTIPVEFQTSDMGVFVTAIAGTVNGTDGRYWVYEINDQKVPVAADAYTLQADDRLVWKFTNPE